MDDEVGRCQGDEDRSDADGDVSQDDEDNVQGIGRPLLTL